MKKLILKEYPKIICDKYLLNHNSTINNSDQTKLIVPYFRTNYPPLNYSLKKYRDFSGGCNPVNWLNQSRKNLAIEYLNFVTTPKLTTSHSFFVEKIFISSVWLIFVLLARTVDSVSRLSFFDIDMFQHILSNLKFSNRLVTVDIFN